MYSNIGERALHSISTSVAMMFAASAPLQGLEASDFCLDLYGDSMKTIVVGVAASMLIATAAWGQADTAVKESGKAVVEKAKEGTERAKAAGSDQPEKTLHKGKAAVHKAKARHHKNKAKDAAKEVTK